ncbi:hypothetical protein DY240_14245, partial [Jiangella rhizosphaerae]
MFHVRQLLERRPRAGRGGVTAAEFGRDLPVRGPVQQRDGDARRRQPERVGDGVPLRPLGRTAAEQRPRGPVVEVEGGRLVQVEDAGQRHHPGRPGRR